MNFLGTFSEALETLTLMHFTNAIIIVRASEINSEDC